MPADNADAIVIRDVVKSFRKSTIRREYTTFKSELIRWIRGQRQQEEMRLIEALRGINLTIPKGRTVGILGRNGSGKSTLLKLITGIYTPTSGSIQVNGRISALLDLGAGFHPDFSGRENILINGIILGMSRAEALERMDDIIAFSELGDFIDEPVRTYSSGMYMRLAFSVATHVDPDILIIDEILAVGDQHFSKKSLAKMTEFKAKGKTIVLVTHDLVSVERWCDMAAWIDAGRIRRVGTPAEVALEYRRAVELAEEQSMVMQPSALVADGAGLPQVTVLRPVTGPQASAEQRSGSFRLEVSRIRLLSSGGVERAEVDTEEPLEVSLDFLSKEPLSGVHFEVVFRREDGVQVYTTGTRGAKLELPSPLPERGNLRLRLARLGLLPGNYFVDVCARGTQDEVLDFQRGLHGLKVSSPSAEGGLVRPLHEWSFEPYAASPAREERTQVIA
ncbi:ABC transporter ATP-binding protein [Archangium sp.]|uniref:ABC transporter ATP-binding protein n=1 Tax=Archangium sp. TaxID=1872627 RepID=UPI002D6CD5C1|nr:ABC transporter ATP-binding protein [Archangium sp.]HYO58510.1 ABC transporter ATP-binding protein [Archangium sp.]